jgi:hypothetical protein
MRDPVEITKRTEYLKRAYGPRNDQYRVNKWAYDGDFDRIMGFYDAPGYGGLDNRKRRSSKIQSWNMMKPVVHATVLQLARMPTIVVPAAKPGNDTAKTAATLIEYFLYWLWEQSSMGMRHMEAAFSMGCYGSACHQLVVDAEQELVIFKEWEPSMCYPMPKGDGQTYDWVSFAWTEEAEGLVTRYPKLKDALPHKGQRYDRLVDIIEYQDKEDYGFIMAGKFVPGMVGYTHNLGFVPVTVTPTIKIPGANKPFGPCDIDQLIAINILMNSLRTKTFDAVEENLYPSVFTIGPTDVPINRGPGRHTHLPEGSDVKRLPPVDIPDQVWEQLQEFQGFIRTHANWSEVWSGQTSQSQASGSAIRRLQGPASGMAGIRQDLLGADLQLMNRYWLQMEQHFFGKKRYDCMSDGNKTLNAAPGKPTEYAMEIIPENDIADYHRNTLEYALFGADINNNLIAIQQLKQLGFVSTEWGMSQMPGITDEKGMKEQIKAEKMEEIELEATLQARLEEIKTQNYIKQQQAMADSQKQIEASKVGGATPGQQTPGVPGNVTLLPQGQPQVMGVGAPLSATPGGPEEVGGLPFTNLKPFGQALGAMGGQAPAGTPPSQMVPGGPPAERPAPAIEQPTGITKDTDTMKVTAEQVTADIQGIQARVTSGEIRSRSGGLKGDVYLLGDLATRGATMGKIELGVTVSGDGQLITNALPQYRGRLAITTLSGAPALGRGVAIVTGGENAVSEQTQAA